MKKFNQVISVEVEVDTVANMLLSTFKTDNPHREMLTETIIMIALQNKNIGLVYNNLNGFTNDIDFKVGQEVAVSNVTGYGYVLNDEGEYKQKSVAIDFAVIKEINITRSDDVLIEFDLLNSKGQSIRDTKWVRHNTLTSPEPQQDLATIAESREYAMQ